MIRLRPTRARTADADHDALLVPAIASIVAGVGIGLTVMQGLLLIV